MMFSVLLAVTARVTAQEAAGGPDPEQIAHQVAAWIVSGGVAEADWSDAGISAARVEIRFERTLVGEGQAVQSKMVGDDGCVLVAARAAMDGLRAHARGMVEGLGPSLAVSVELGGPWVPMTAAELEAPDLMLSRGLDSLGVRGLGDERAVFASHFHARSVVVHPMGQSLSTLAAGVLEDPEAAAMSPVDLAARRGVRFYRFEAQHWAQLGPGREMLRLHRGGRVIPERRAWDPAFSAGLADELTNHLWARAEHGGGGQWGPISILDGQSEVNEDVTARARRESDLVRALVLVALHRASECESLSDATRTRARDSAKLVWADSDSWVGVSADEVMSPQVAGLLWMADSQHHGSEELRAAVEASLDSLMEQLEMVPWRGTQQEAIALWALAQRAAENAEDRERVRTALGKMLSVRGLEGMVSVLPWSAWTDAVLHDDGSMQSRSALREVRTVMWDHQFESRDVSRGSEEFVGGLVFGTGGTGGVGGGGLPSSSTIRPMTFAAWALGQEALTSQTEVLGDMDRRGELLRVTSGMRFVGQLMVSDHEAYGAVLPGRVVGGVRRSLWDSEVHAEDSAAALLACVEMLDSLRAISSRGPAEVVHEGE